MPKNYPPIHLRAIEPEDIQYLAEIENDSSQWNLAEQTAPVSMEMLRQYVSSYSADPYASGQLRLAIADAETKDLVGLIDLYEIEAIHQRAFVGVYIRNPYRNLGYSVAALRKVEQYSREVLGLHQLAARVMADNVASLHLFRRSGYRKVATLTDWYRHGHGFRSAIVFQRLLV